ncbi:MAG: hypothetical protein U9O96_04055 [Candidatus Thermoplasmatota archaeon]|nr:hypothetical protein [Candidatus Thermoplasmatota archaeon]
MEAGRVARLCAFKQCEFWLNYNGVSCIEPAGVKYKQPIGNSLEEIDRTAYLEKGVAGSTGMG